MTRRRILVGGGLFIGVALLALAAVALVIVFNDGADEGERAGDDPSERTDTPERRAERAPEEPTSEVEQEVALVGIVPSPRIVRLDGPGETETLTVRGYYSDRSERDLDEGVGATVSYSSSDSSVAEVDERGVITGLEPGGADIVVSFGDLTATVPVLVWGPMRSVPPVDPERLLEIEEGGAAIVLNRVMVELEPGHDATDAEEVAAEIDGQIVFEFQTFPGYLLEFDGSSQRDMEEALAVLRNDERVAAAYADMLVSTDQGNGNGQGRIETLLSENGGEDWGYYGAGMHEAWTTMNLIDQLSPVVIVVIDNLFPVPPTRDYDVDAVLYREFDYRRLDVRDAVDLAGRDVPWRDTNDPGGDAHGVAVTSVIVAQNNDRGDDTVPEESFSGVITSVDNLAYHVVFYQAAGGRGGLLGVPGLFGALNVAAVTAAFEDIVKYQGQIDVVNMSLGINCSIGSLCHLVAGYDERWAELLTDAPEMTFVFAAGNDGKDAADVIPAALSANLPNVITVGGTHFREADGRRTHVKLPDSNYGPVVTLGTSYEVWAVALEAESSYKLLEGTSLSAPMVTGAVALLKALDPTLTPEKIKQILVSTGPLADVCNFTFPPCPDHDQGRWPILDSGEAVSSLLWPSIDAAIDLDRQDLNDAASGSGVELTFPVVNTGSKDWTFYLSVEAKSPSGEAHAFGPMHNHVAAGESHPFKLNLKGDPVEVGEWSFIVKLYRNPELTSLPDLRAFRLQIVPGAESAVADPADTENSGSSLFPSTGEQNIQDDDPGERESRLSDGPTVQGYGSVKGDRAALVALYNATGGPHWKINNNWLSDVPIGEWIGVTTDDNGRVIELALGVNQLSGEIPAELGDLTNLEGLWLDRNQLTGEIPAELGNLTNLTHLYLRVNQLSGEIPPELDNLANLRELRLRENQLSGEIPPELGNLAKLRYLSLTDNQLSGEIPPELGNLANLNGLSLSRNQLSGEIPPELGSLANLIQLDLDSNDLNGEIPPELGNLAKLRYLSLFRNSLSGEIPPELGNLGNLYWLWLEGNQLSGEIPPELGNLANLSDLGRNQLSGKIEGNQLSGKIPPELGNLANLTRLDLRGNQLTGCVPSSLSGQSENSASSVMTPRLVGFPFCP